MMLSLLHAGLGLLGFWSGARAATGMWTESTLDVWTPLFLLSAAWTSATGLLFYPTVSAASCAIAALSLLALAAAVLALYIHRLAGGWRSIYIVGVALALYLHFLAGVLHVADKLPALEVLFAIRFEPPFIAANVAIAAPFLFFALLALKQFHPVVTQRRSRGAREATRRT
jgi:hypothetical protein